MARFFGGPREALALAVVFALGYGAVAYAFCAGAPRLFGELDQAFDADLGLWTIDIARPQGPHLRTRIHPLSVLLLNPAGGALRGALHTAGVPFAARQAAALLCALAGGLAVGVFRLLLARLGVGDRRALLWTLVFGVSAAQLVFSSLPESYAFSALGLLLVFAVGAGERPSRGARLAAAVFAFGINVFNILAAVLTGATVSAASPGERLRRTARQAALVLALTSVLALVQRAAYPTSELFFVPRRLSSGYTDAFVSETTPAGVLSRLGAVVSYVLFAGLAAPRLQVDAARAPRVVVDFASQPLTTPTRWSGPAWLLWATLLVRAGWGLGARLRPGGGHAGESANPRGVLLALSAWLASVVALHMAFGTSLFLYSGQWTFAVVALAAAGLEARPFRGATAVLGALVTLQLLGNGALLRQILDTFSR